MKGFSVKYGRFSKVTLYTYPRLYQVPFMPEDYIQWLESAEEFCEKANEVIRSENSG